MKSTSEIKISVIIPVYKAEEFLRRCLDSVLTQTHRNLELLLVDDGSPDACGRICDEYAARDNRVVSIHTPNAGAFAARNLALDRATGDYIGFAVGTELVDYNVDEYIFVGADPDATQKDLDWYGHSYALYEGAKSVITDRPLSYYHDLKAVAKRLQEVTRPGDVIYFKGLYRLCFLAIIDMAFGTAYTNYHPYYAGQKVVDQGYTAKYFKEFDGCNIILCSATDQNVVIPNTLAGKSVFRVGKKIFQNRNIKSVNFGKSVSTIGEYCFSNCKNLKSLVIPSNVINIEAHAFSACTGLQNVDIHHAAHIGKRAFAGCVNLKDVTLTHRCVMLEDDVFADCNQVTIHAPKNSYAYEYALKNGLKVETE